MLSYIIRRLLLLIPMAAGMVIVTFGLLLLVPGDPAHVLLGPEATPEMIANLRTTLGLDNPWYVRLWDYFAHLAQGDMGRSIFRTPRSPRSSPAGSAPLSSSPWSRCCSPASSASALA